MKCLLNIHNLKDKSEHLTQSKSEQKEKKNRKEKEEKEIELND